MQNTARKLWFRWWLALICVAAMPIRASALPAAHFDASANDLANATPLPAQATEIGETARLPQTKPSPTPAVAQPQVTPRWPWVRAILAGTCLLFAADADDGSARVGWVMLGGGLAGWAAWDVMHPLRPTWTIGPKSRLAIVRVTF